jgi:hypothetical protein
MDEQTPGCYYSFNHILPGENSLSWPIGSGNSLADIWQAAGLPSVPCQSQYGPWCDPSKLPSPWILDRAPGDDSSTNPENSETRQAAKPTFLHPTTDQCRQIAIDGSQYVMAGNILWTTAKGMLKSPWTAPASPYVGAAAVAAMSAAIPNAFY